MSVYLTIRTQSELDVRYDAPPPGRAHEGAVSLTLPDAGLFAIFTSPDECDALAAKLHAKAAEWRTALCGHTDDGCHSREVDPFEDTTVIYPDPEQLHEQARATMEAM